MLTLWDERWIEVAKHIGTWSKDPRRKIGCVIIDDDRNQLSGGYNGFPRGMKDDTRLQVKEFKNKVIVHAEANAVAAAARNGHSLKNSTVYISQFPCTQCVSLLIQAGVKRIVAEKQLGEYSTDTELDWNIARDLIIEVDILYLYIFPKPINEFI